MKTETYIIFMGIFLVLGLSFLIFNIQNYNFIGFVVYNENSENITKQESNQTAITKEIAMQAINESEKIIKEMQENNFSVNYMIDSLIEARRAFEQARYAEILREEINSTEKEKQEARNALRLVKWQNITYGRVLSYMEDIEKRKKTAFLLLDRIAIEENNFNNNAELKSVGLFSSSQPVISNETMDILLQAKMAFFEERYNDVEKLLGDFDKAVEKEKADASTLSGIKKGAKNFIQEYWIHIMILSILIGILSYLAYKRFQKKLLINRIKKIKTEEQVLNDLIKKTQEERFKENKISGLVYNIRMDEYKKRLNEIKEILPVFETRLNKHKKFHLVKNPLYNPLKT